MSDTPDRPTRLATMRRLWRRILLLFLPWPLVLIPLAVVSYDSLSESRWRPLAQQEREVLARGVQVISRSLSALRRDVRLMYQEPLLDQAVNGGDRHALAAYFQRFATATQIYDQIRWLDRSGQERVRVDFRGDIADAVADSELQDKSSRPYFYKTLPLPPGDIYLSRLDLNIEHGRIESAHRPMLRIASPLHDLTGGPAGILVLNFNANILLTRLSELPGDANVDITLVNDEGYLLFGPHEEDLWGDQLDHPERTLARMHPKLWQAMLLQQGSWSDKQDRWQFARLTPTTEIMGKRGDGSRSIGHWYLLTHRSLQDVQHYDSRVKAVIAATCGIALVLALLLSIRISFFYDEREQSLRLLRAQHEALQQSNTALQTSLDTQRNLQSELIRAEKLSSLGLMVAGVAHELNTPLGSALVSISNLQRQFGQLEEQLRSGLRRSDLDLFMADGHEGLELSHTALQRAADLVRRFKQLAVDRSSVERRHFMLDEVVIDSLHLLLRKRDATPALLLDVPALPLDSFPGPLGQIINNLVNNALMHAFDPGQPGEIWVRGRAEGEQVILTVSDNGRGMDADTAARAFDLFFTTRRGSGGTGLGLFLAHQLAHDVLGGSLTLHAAPGTGCCFTLTLPRLAPDILPTPK